MGMFDYLTCNAPLPVPGFEGHRWQTKSLECDLDNYEIREDGTLWHEEYDIEDRSDPNAEGFHRFRGMLTRGNKQWEQCFGFTGEILFYDVVDREHNTGWIEFSAYFVAGTLKELHCVVHRPPDSPANH